MKKKEGLLVAIAGTAGWVILHLYQIVMTNKITFQNGRGYWIITNMKLNWGFISPKGDSQKVEKN